MSRERGDRGREVLTADIGSTISHSSVTLEERIRTQIINPVSDLAGPCSASEAQKRRRTVLNHDERADGTCQARSVILIPRLQVQPTPTAQMGIASMSRGSRSGAERASSARVSHTATAREFGGGRPSRRRLSPSPEPSVRWNGAILIPPARQ